MLKRTLVLLFIIFSSCAFAKEPEDYSVEEFHGWVKGFSERARAEGISNETIYEFMRDAQFLPRVIKLDRKQPHATKTFDEYIESSITKARVNEANKKYNENKKLLTEIGEKYGVQPRFIVALWAIESNFGTNMGGFKVVDSLATLAYEGRRREFFEEELIKALRVVDNGHIKMSEMKGSWAGAMGQTQFMPSSYLDLAVDYDGDGKKDIWGTKADVFASIANYLSKTGWDNNVTWGREALVPNNFDSSLFGKEISKPLTTWQQLGVRNVDGKNLPEREDLLASLVKPEDNKDRAYLIYSNYKTILKWNRSLYFATSVGILADSIR